MVEVDSFVEMAMVVISLKEKYKYVCVSSDIPIPTTLTHKTSYIVLEKRRLLSSFRVLQIQRNSLRAQFTQREEKTKCLVNLYIKTVHGWCVV